MVRLTRSQFIKSLERHVTPVMSDEACFYRRGCGSRPAPSKGKSTEVARPLYAFKPCPAFCFIDLKSDVISLRRHLMCFVCHSTISQPSSAATTPPVALGPDAGLGNLVRRCF